MARRLRRILFFLCLLIVLCLPFDFLLKEAGLHTPFIKSYQEVLIIALLLLWELLIIVERRITFRHTTIDYPLIAFFAIHIFSSLFPSTYVIWSLKYTFRLFGFGALFYAIVNFANSKRRLNLLINILLLSATLAAALAIAQKFHYYGRIGNFIAGIQNFLEDIAERPDKIRGPFLWPSVLACYMASLIPLSVSLLVWGPKGLAKKTLLLLVTLTISAALFLSRVNIGIIAAGGGLLGMFIIYIYKQTRSKVILCVFATLLVLCVMGFLVLINNVNIRPYIFNHIPELETIYEQGLWKAGLNMTVSRPAKGWGADMFYWRYPEFTPSGMPAGFKPVYRSHNIFLEVGSGMGILGMLVFIWLLVSIFKTLRDRFLDSDIGPFWLAVQLGIIGSLITFFIHSQLGFFWVVHETLGLFWALVGIGTCGSLISITEGKLKG